MNIVLHICKDMESTQIVYENIGSKIGRNSQFTNNRQIIDYDKDQLHIFTDVDILKNDIEYRAIIEYHLYECDLDDQLQTLIDSHLVLL